MDERAERALDAHVAHELTRLRGASLAELIEGRVVAVFTWFDELRFADAVSVEDVVTLAQRYALELRVSGGISELAGEIARLVVTSGANAEVTVGDVVSSESFEEFSEKVLGLDDVRAEIISLVARSEALGVFTARVVAHVLVDLLRRAGDRAKVGPVQGVVASAQRTLLPAIERRFAALFGQRLLEHRSLFASEVEHHLRDVLDADALHEVGEELWLHLSRKRMDEAMAVLGAQDLEDFVILCFEFWLRFRKTTYMRRILSEAVRYFFEKYGDESVSEVILDMGVTQEMVANELKTFLIPLSEKAAASGFLERELRLHLEDFYASQAFLDALEPA